MPTTHMKGRERKEHGSGHARASQLGVGRRGRCWKGTTTLAARQGPAHLGGGAWAGEVDLPGRGVGEEQADIVPVDPQLPQGVGLQGEQGRFIMQCLYCMAYYIIQR